MHQFLKACLGYQYCIVLASIAGTYDPHEMYRSKYRSLPDFAGHIGKYWPFWPN